MRDLDWASIFLAVLVVKHGGEIRLTEDDIKQLPGGTRLRIRVRDGGLVAELVTEDGSPVSGVPAGVVIQ